MRFDPSGLYQAFDRMEKEAGSTGLTLAEAQARDYQKSLFDEGVKIAPTIAYLEDLCINKLHWRLKRDPGVSAGREMQRRMRARKTFARGWEIQQTKERNKVITIGIVNHSVYSGPVDEKHSIQKKAAKATADKFHKRLESLAKQATGVFAR